VIHHPIELLGLTCLVLATLHAQLILVAVVTWYLRRKSASAPITSRVQPVTVLKPLCGAEPGLYLQLRSFCLQDHPQFQIVFGTRDAADPALAVARRLAAEFPDLSIDIMVNPQQHGSNYKCSNLHNMMALARYDLIAIADSDTSVRPDYLRMVTTPLLDPCVGLVTSLSHDVPTPLLWSRLGAMYMNEWFMPGVLLTWLFGYRGYASGQTLCLRRDTLEAIGGFGAIADYLAEDYRLGKLIRDIGLQIVISPAIVTAEHHEPSLDALTRHEIRWMRTIRVLRPRSFRMLFLSFSMPLAIVGLAACAYDHSLSSIAWTLFAATVFARLGLHLVHRLDCERPVLSDLWLLPLRDLLLCWVWCRSFFSSRVTWRGREFEVSVDGMIRQET
jgi:ceramide glucosyltransferase